ncbi:MAG: hypothetical protein IKA31_03445 [Clostridia bacterium]|nr:hypothetical protein [Clostridia bacterium]MBR4003603.1 hypothetical protein [Clostridia bacterium]
MTKYEELLKKINDEVSQSAKEWLSAALIDQKPNTDFFLKIELANFIFRNKGCLSDELIENLLEREKPLSDMFSTLNDYVFIDGILIEIFEDAFVNDEENKDYIREMTYGDYEEDDDYEDEEEIEEEEEDEVEKEYADCINSQDVREFGLVKKSNDYSEDEEDYEDVDTLDDLDCEREDLESYTEYLDEHDEGFIHDNEDC